MPASLGLFELIAFFMCLVASAFFSGSEAILLSIGIDRAQRLIEKGGASARALTFMMERPNELLTTILVGNNIVNILAASLSTTAVSRYFNSEAIGVSAGITTFFVLIFGEVLPKTFARAHAERFAFYVISILRVVYYCSYPIIKGMVWLIETVLGDNAHIKGKIVTRKDIEYMLNRADKEKTMDSKQVDLLSSVLDFPTIKVKDIMVPRNRVKYIKLGQSFQDILSDLKGDSHSRYPVCAGELENTLGFLHVKDLAFVKVEDRKNFDVKKVLKAPFFVYEHMKIQAVFDHMNRKKVHLALVKDENGLVVGIVTLEDIVEEVFGEIQDEHDLETEEVQQEYEQSDIEVGIYVPGSISLRDLYNEYDIKIPLNDNYSTLGGFLLDMLGNGFPDEGQLIVWEGLSFELMEVDGFEIKEVHIKNIDGERHLYSKNSNVEETEAASAVAEPVNRENKSTERERMQLSFSTPKMKMRRL